MKKVFLYKSYKPAYSSVKEVIQAMLDLETELQNTNMKNLIAFNHTYLIITTAVYQKIGKKYFHHDDIMQEVDICFAQYYFDALKRYVDGKDCPPSWRVLFDECKKNSQLQSIYMGMGVNAHVNNDLAFTLFDVVKIKDYQRDYDKVNILIKESLQEVVECLQEHSPIINGLKNGLRFIYGFVLNLLIQHWRKKAWNHFVLLEKESIADAMIENRALRIAKQLALVPLISL